MKFNLFLFLIFLSACIQEIPFPEQKEPAKLVVGCLFAADSVFNVYVNKTQGIFDSTESYVDNATVEIWENTNKIETLQHIEKGLYRSNILAQTGKAYTLKVSAPGYTDVTAIDTIPEKQRIISANLKIKAGWSYTYLANYSTVNLSFTNKLSKSLYFESQLVFNSWVYADILSEQASFSEDTIRYNSVVSLMSSDELFIQQENYKFDGVTRVNSLVFTNQLIDKEQASLLIKFYNGGYDIGTQVYLIVYLRSISKNYYQYKKTLRKHLENQGLTDPASLEDYALLSFQGLPENVYTNVKNGYGIFAAYSLDTVSFKVEASDF